jgi:hypothetical protein
MQISFILLSHNKFHYLHQGALHAPFFPLGPECLNQAPEAAQIPKIKAVPVRLMHLKFINRIAVLGANYFQI